MTRYTIAILYIGAIASLGAVAVRRWASSAPSPSAAGLQISRVRAGQGDSLAAQLDSAEDYTVSNDPFRLANAPARVRYNPAMDGPSLSGAFVAPPPIRPILVLKAIVGGPPWQAIVDGLPGQPSGTIARAGSVFDKLSVRAVTRDSVVVQGPDTTWVLSFIKRS